MKKYWTKARQKPSRANSKSCSSISAVKGLRWLLPSSFADPSCVFLSWFAPTLYCSSPCRDLTGFWHLQHLGISNTIQAWLSQLHVWFLWASMQELPCHTPGLRGFSESFKGSINYHLGRKHGNIQAGMTLAKLRVLHLVPKTNRRRLESRKLGGRSLKVHS